MAKINARISKSQEKAIDEELQIRIKSKTSGKIRKIMICLSPESIKRPGGNDVRDRITVPCGKCANCLSNQRSDWTFRLNQELKNSSSAYFVTLTYSEENVPYIGETSTLRKKDLQDFIKRLRRYHDMEVEKYQKLVNASYIELNPPQIRYYAIGEYGPETLRPHYHGLFFNVSPEVIQHIEKIWKLGFIKVGDVNTASIHYCTKYVINRKTECPGVEEQFSIMSRRPGIGYSYINNKSLRYHRQEQGQKFEVTTEDGRIQRMPRYYKQFIFTKKELQGNAKKIETEMDHTFDEDMEKVRSNYGGDVGRGLLELSLNRERRFKKLNKKGNLL